MENSSNARYYCHVFPGADLGGLSVNGDILLSETGEEKAKTAEVEISVTLPEACETEKEFAVCAVWDDDYDFSFVTVDAGQDAFSEALTLDKSEEYAIGYFDVTDCGAIYGFDGASDMRYLSESGGVTSMREKAKKFRFSGDSSVSLQEPVCGRVTGRVDRNGFNAGYRADAYAYALFPDGERCSARVLLGTADSAEYVIYVPMAYSGQQFELNAAMAYPDSNRLIESSASEAVSHTFNGNVSAGTVSVSGDYWPVSGTLSLPNGVRAPAGGHAVEIWTENSGDIYYVIPAGQNSVRFSFHSYHEEDRRYASLGASLEGGLSGAYDSISQSHSFDNSASEAEQKAWYQQQSLAFPASAVISGTVSFSSNARDVGAQFRLYGYFDEEDNPFDASVSSSVAILQGQRSAPYRLTVPVGQLSYLKLSVNGSTDGRAADDALYVDSAWNVTKETGGNNNRPSGPNVTGDRSNVNFTLDVFSDGVKPQIMSVEAASAQENETVFDSLRRGGSLSVAYVGPTGTSAAIIVALYDSEGRLLKVSQNSYVTLKREKQNVSFWFSSETISDAATIRAFLIGRNSRQPLARDFTLRA